MKGPAHGKRRGAGCGSEDGPPPGCPWGLGCLRVQCGSCVPGRHSSALRLYPLLKTVETAPRRGPYYGWYIVVVAFFTGFARAGFTGVLFGIFLKPMAEALGASRAKVTGAVTAGTIVAAAGGFFAGPILDRYGPRLMFTLGGIAIAMAYFGLANVLTLAGFVGVQGLVMFYLVYVLGRAVTQSIVGETLVGAVVSKWFIRLRGRAVALAATGTPVAGLFLAVGLQAIMDASSWRLAWAALGAIALVLLVLPPALVLRRSPEDMGLLPDGALPAASEASPGARAAVEVGRRRPAAAEEDHWRLSEARKTVAFWSLMAVSSLGALGNTAINFHMVPHFTDVGVPKLAAATALGLFGAVQAIAMPFWGLLTERLHVRYVLLLVNTVQLTGVALVTITKGPGPFMAYLAAMVYGIGMGGFLTLLSVTWATYFGRRYLGAIRGWEIAFRMSANAFGPLMAAVVYDTTRSYRGAFSVSFGIILLIMLLVFLTKPPQRRREPDTAGKV